MLTLLTGKIGIAAVAGLLAAGGLGFGFLKVRAHYIELGEQRVLAKIAKKDNAAVKKKSEIDRMVAQCFDTGGKDFNVEDMTCER